MRTFRKERLSSLIQEKLAWMIEREVEVPNALLTITEVNITDKLESAEVKISAFPSDKKIEAMKLLIKMTPSIQFKLSRILNIRPMPVIHFKYDEGPNRAAAVEKGLAKESEQLESSPLNKEE